MGPGPGPMGPGPSEELFVGYQQLRAGCRCRAEGLFASRDLGSLIISDLGPPVEFGSPSPFANLPFSFEPFPSRLNTSWFVGTADGINTAEVVMKVGGYDGGFEARVGCSFFRRTSLLSALGPNGPGQMGRAKRGRAKGAGPGPKGKAKSLQAWPKVYRVFLLHSR